MSMYLPNMFPMVLNYSSSKQIETSVEELANLVMWLGFLLLIEIKHPPTQIHLTSPKKLWVIFKNIFLNQGLSQKIRCRIHLHRNSRGSNPLHVRDPLLMELVIHGFGFIQLLVNNSTRVTFAKIINFFSSAFE